MKVLMINGSPHKSGCTFTALSEVSKSINARGIETEIYHIGNEPISGCQACGNCKKTGKCIINDTVNELAAKLDNYDGLIVGSPVYYAGMSGQISSFLDRLFFSAGSKLKNKPAAAVVSCRRGGASAAFDRLNKYFTINCMPIAASQYWNQVHGNNPEQVLEDIESLQTMRTLGENMAWLLQSIDAGRKAGIAQPTYESQIKTNFVR